MPAVVLTGNLAIGASTGNDATTEDADSITAVDMSAEVTSFAVSAQIEQITVPTTMTVPEHARGGAADYFVTIGYLSNDVGNLLFPALWAALAASGKLFFSGSIHTGAVSGTNPEWSGEFIVTEASIGAAAQQLSTGKATFPMTGAPIMETA